MSTSSAMLPSGSAPGEPAASGAFGGSPCQPPPTPWSYLAGTRTALAPPTFGVVPPAADGTPSSQKV